MECNESATNKYPTCRDHFVSKNSSRCFGKTHEEFHPQCRIANTCQTPSGGCIVSFEDEPRKPHEPIRCLTDHNTIERKIEDSPDQRRANTDRDKK